MGLHWLRGRWRLGPRRLVVKFFICSLQSRAKNSKKTSRIKKFFNLKKFCLPFMFFFIIFEFLTKFGATKMHKNVFLKFLKLFSAFSLVTNDFYFFYAAVFKKKNFIVDLRAFLMLFWCYFEIKSWSSKIPVFFSLFWSIFYFYVFFIFIYAGFWINICGDFTINCSWTF